MAAPKKFQPGPAIESFDELEKCLGRTGYVFIFGDKPKHAGFVRSQRYGVLLARMRAGGIKRALIRDEWAEWAESRELKGAA